MGKPYRVNGLSEGLAPQAFEAQSRLAEPSGGQVGDQAVAVHETATISSVKHPRLAQAWSSAERGRGSTLSQRVKGKEKGDSKKPLVLLAEDGSDEAGMLRDSLERDGYRIVDGADGEEGLMVIPISKSSSPSELMARIRTVIRRWSPDLSDESLSFEDIFMDLVAHRVRRGERDVHLGPTEFRLLRHLMENPGEVFSRKQLLDAAWGRHVYVEPRTVDVHIRRLRMALNGKNEPDFIRTVRSAGYAIDRPREEQPAAE